MPQSTPGSYKQLNVRIPLDLLEDIHSAADREGLTAQAWVKNACRSILKKDIPGTIGRSEFECAIAGLSREIKELRQISEEKSQAIKRLEMSLIQPNL